MPPSLFQTSSWTCLCLLSLLLCNVFVSIKASRKRPNQSSPSPAAPTSGGLDDWIRSRCSDEGVALWVYEGALFDPLEGRRIANVEGLELVRCVASVGHSSNPDSKKQYQHQCGDLEVGPLISHENATFDQVSTILSRKLFCYQSPDNPNQLLTSIRLRPNAPLRSIPTRQAVAAYDTATTFIARGKELIAHTEWPDRQSIWGMATRNFAPKSEEPSTSEESTPSSFDFTIYARQKSARKKAEQLFDLSKPPADPSMSNSSTLVVAPRRAKLIEFGTSSSRGKDKFGARETYSYSNVLPQSTPRVRYSRYGEGPPFFGPGRVCSLELQGRRISSLDEVPALTASLLSQRMAPNSFNQTVAVESLEWFRSGPGLEVRPGEDERPDFWLPDYLKDKGLAFWSKVRRRRRNS